MSHCREAKFNFRHFQGEVRQLRQDKSRADDKVQELEIVSICIVQSFCYCKTLNICSINILQFNQNDILAPFNFGGYDTPQLRLLKKILCIFFDSFPTLLFSLPGRSPGRAILLPPVSALALAAAAAASALAKC